MLRAVLVISAATLAGVGYLIYRQERLMATATEQITALSGKVDALAAKTADILADFRAFRDAMTAERENLTAAGQAALDEANAKTDAAAASLSELDVEVGDADGSDTPVETPVDPTV